MPDSPTARPLDDRAAALALLRWYVEMGADEAIGDVALNRLASPAPIPVARAASPAAAAPVIARQQTPPTPVAPPGTFAESLAEAVQSARRLAATAGSIDQPAPPPPPFAPC